MWGKKTRRPGVVARHRPILLLETMLAKEAKTMDHPVVEIT